MEHTVIPVSAPCRDTDDQNSQLYIVDGCKVRVNFLPKGSNSDTLNRIQKSLLASGLTK